MNDDEMDGRFYFDMEGEFQGQASRTDHHCIVMKLVKNKKSSEID